MQNTEQKNKYSRERDRVATLKKFYAKIMSGLIAIGITGGINYYFNEWEYPWFLWVVFGVSIGIFFRAIKIFNLNPFMGKDWEDRKIREFIKKDENQERWK